MSSDDIMFTTASLIAVTGFLRGGEFLTGPKSGRPRLDRSHVTVREVSGVPVVVVGVRQPKTRWWIDTVDVPCFPPGEAVDFSPVFWWEAHVRRSPGSKGAAFKMSNGNALTREFMVRKTSELMTASNIRFGNKHGVAMSVKMASWRSGAVRSAVDAKADAPTIQALGRWTSDAWQKYLLHSCADLQGAVTAMWSVEMKVMESPDLRVAECVTVGHFVNSKEDEQALCTKKQMRQRWKEWRKQGGNRK